MACDRCISAQRDTLVIGTPVECRCDYCGGYFIAGKPSQCVSCFYYMQNQTEEGYRYMCENEDADGKDNCSGYINEDEYYRHKMEDRKITLLKACRDLLMKQKEAHYVLNLLSETVFYDDADCDGGCLLEDIEVELEYGE